MYTQNHSYCFVIRHFSWCFLISAALFTFLAVPSVTDAGNKEGAEQNIVTITHLVDEAKCRVMIG